MSAGDGGIVELWATTLYQRQLTDVEDINARLRDEILTREKTDRSRSLGVVNARKSSPDLLRWGLPETDALAGWIGEAVDELTRSVLGADPPDISLTAHAWAVVYRPGGYHTLHGHRDSAWSGVYYVQANAHQAAGGAIDLLDPRIALLARHPIWQEPTVQVQPRSGLLLAFPSWLQHSVTAVEGSAPRICIGFNVGLG
jgi:uncharacterized protein (TIGR02466 family)